MKKYRKIFWVITASFFIFIIILIMWVKSLLYIMENRDEIVFSFLLYDYVEYNGNAYYPAEDQHESFPYTGTEERGPVYMVYKGSKIYYGSCNTARVYIGYEGDIEEVYMFFDSAIYILEDYRDIESEQ